MNATKLVIGAGMLIALAAVPTVAADHGDGISLQDCLATFREEGAPCQDENDVVVQMEECQRALTDPHSLDEIKAECGAD